MALKDPKVEQVQLETLVLLVKQEKRSVNNFKFPGALADDVSLSFKNIFSHPCQKSRGFNDISSISIYC